MSPPDPGDPYTFLLPALSPPPFPRGRTALLVVDMQYLDASPDHGWGRRLREQGKFDLAAPFFERLSTRVIPNLRALLSGARRNRLEVVFVRIAAQKSDLSDASPHYRLRGFDSTLGSVEAQILAEIAPREGEIVLSKTSTGAFATTALDQTLRNLGVEMLIVAGVNTDACVEMTCRDAADRGYWVVAVEDACAALGGEERHQQALKRLDQGVVSLASTEEVVHRMDAVGGVRADGPRGPSPST
ncbi:MAG: cysteine hydrolase family protein [Candidatus Dormibacterales bacterium]